MSRHGRKHTLEETEESCETEVCVIHFKDSKCERFTLISSLSDPEARLKALQKTRDDRRSQPLHSAHRMGSVCDQIPDSLSPFHGYHRDCYQQFTGNMKRLSHSDAGPNPSPEARRGRRDSATKDRILFKKDCIFCNSEGRKKVKKGAVKTTEGLSVFEKGGGVTILKIAEGKQDEQLLCRIRGFDLFACEAQYHPSCRTQYLQNPMKWRSTDEDSVKEDDSITEAHGLAFSKVCQVISDEVIKKKKVVKLSDLNKIYISEFFFFFMNGNTERAHCALSRVCIP